MDVGFVEAGATITVDQPISNPNFELEKDSTATKDKKAAPKSADDKEQ